MLRDSHRYWYIHRSLHGPMMREHTDDRMNTQYDTVEIKINTE